jgi:hypothetical protein
MNAGDDTANEGEEMIVALLTPLAEIPPVVRHRSAVRRTSLVAGVVATGLLVGAGAFAMDHFGSPLANTTFQPPAGKATCLAFGKPGPEAASLLQAHGYSVSWRSETWGDEVLGDSTPAKDAPTMVGGGQSTAIESPPSESVLIQALPTGPSDVIAFVSDPSDPNAPIFQRPDCG